MGFLIRKRYKEIGNWFWILDLKMKHEMWYENTFPYAKKEKRLGGPIQWRVP